ncbi:MAG: DUF2283 domain-containing protein [Methanobrevibacter sp.]|jgi:uncharacterized protein YuzE|nr:DUF2283 domain-containing protein [Candidatus Methanovirga meridionalis]
MINKEVIHITYEYDASADAMFIEVENYEHEESVSLNNNLIMDFNKNHEFIALEILNASDVLDTNKHSLKKIINIDLRVKVTKDQIFISSILTLPVQNKHVFKETNESIINDMNIPVMDTNLVTA